MAETKLSLKLLVDKISNRLLFAEVGKDFVDFLFHLLSLPIGTVIRLLESSNMVGSVGNLYMSFENLNESYIQPNQRKETLLKPQLLAPASGIPMLLPDMSQSPSTRKLYICPNNHPCVTDNPSLTCGSCHYQMYNKVKFISSENAAKPDGSGGYVRGLVTYMVTDDLTVTPISMISGVAMINKCNVQDFSSPEERVVECGIQEGLELLKASLRTKAVLTSVFMPKEKKVGDLSS